MAKQYRACIFEVLVNYLRLCYSFFGATLALVVSNHVVGTAAANPKPRSVEHPKTYHTQPSHEPYQPEPSASPKHWL